MPHTYSRNNLISVLLILSGLLLPSSQSSAGAQQRPRAAGSTRGVCLPCQQIDNLCCKGDINGDGVLDSADMDLFATVLIDGHVDAAVQCRSDMNCDGLVDGNDVPFFTTAIFSGCSCIGRCCSPNGNCQAISVSQCYEIGGTFDQIGRAHV